MLLLVPVAVVLFLAPGYFLSRLLGSRAPWASAFILSLLVLFYGAFLAGVCGLPVCFGSVALWLAAVTVLAAGAARHAAPPPGRLPAGKGAPLGSLGRAALAAAGVIGAGLLLSCTLRPLTGYDTYWRWDFLARRVLGLESFDFYPPRTPRDFAVYFYAEAIPPLVSFAYWWLYAAAGRHLPELTALFVVGQYAAVVWLTCRTGAALFSRRAGFFAAIVLATSLLFYRALAIGQETGLTALAMIAITYFIASAGEGSDYRAMVLAGLAAAVGALAREYGWAFAAYGVLVLLWRRRGWQEVVVFGLTALAVAGPWYLRTLLLTGNPLFSNRLLGLPVNPVHAAIMDSYRERLGVSHWPASRWLDLGFYLASYAPLQLLLGPPAALVVARRHGYLGLGALLVVGLYLSSIAYTSGGEFYAARVLAPALVLLSLPAGALLARLRWPPAVLVVSLLLAVLWARAAVYAAIYPATVYPAPNRLDPSSWLGAALDYEPGAPLYGGRHEEALPRLLPEKLPTGTRLLAENVFAHAALADTGYDVVPIWSPEVAFLFDKGVDARAAQRRLWELGIRAIVYNPLSLNSDYQRRESPFFRDASDGWAPLLELEGTKTVIYGLPPPE